MRSDKYALIASWHDLTLMFECMCSGCLDGDLDCNACILVRNGMDIHDCPIKDVRANGDDLMEEAIILDLVKKVEQ